MKDFWDRNPLWSGESPNTPGTCEFFEEHDRVVIEDGFAGELDERIFPGGETRGRVLDLGYGPGFWTVQLGKRGFQVTAADLTEKAVRLAEQRCRLFGVKAEFSVQNAEQMTFPDGTFSHVNCQGVIHHTPDTEACVGEIARVLAPGGTASVAVYYCNLILRSWPLPSWAGALLHRTGAALRGRGREHIYNVKDVNELVRLYDGADNPVGKYYSRHEFCAMLRPYFEVRETFQHFFPARTLPFRLARSLPGWLDRRAGFLIYASLIKR